MSNAYQAIGWNRQKKIYDRTLWLGIFLYMLVFIGGMLALHPEMHNNVERKRWGYNNTFFLAYKY